jgi:hypothetical protein
MNTRTISCRALVAGRIDCRLQIGRLIGNTDTARQEYHNPQDCSEAELAQMVQLINRIHALFS